MKSQWKCWVAMLAMALGSVVPPAGAAVRTTAAPGYWTNAATWDGGVTIPQGSDDVILNHTVTNDVTTPELASFSNNATFVFIGTNTALRAATVTVNGTVTHPTQSDTNGTPGVYADWTPDSRVWIVCSNLTVCGGRSIDVSAKGYLGAPGSLYYGFGPGAGWNYHGGGGGYGGSGGVQPGNGAVAGVAYGTAAAPADPGSGGSGGLGTGGGNGGGFVVIMATGSVRVDGSILANGGAGTSYCGGGSGGGVSVACQTLQGGGAIRANGGDGWLGNGGGGSGGRIAIAYDRLAQSALGSQPTVALSCHPGNFTDTGSRVAFPGTIHLTGDEFYPRTSMPDSGVLLSPGITHVVLSSLSVSNAWLEMPSNVTLTVSGDATVSGGYATRLVLHRPPALAVGGRLLVTNGAALYVNAGATSGAAWPECGTLVTVAGELAVGAGSSLYPVSHRSNGGSVKFQVGALDVAAGGSINAAGQGYDRGTTGAGAGPGRGYYKANGAGYGGQGGRSDQGGAAGTTYGDPQQPLAPGSGGGGEGGNVNYPAGYGGGLIWVEVARIARIGGSLLANGGNSANWAGAGSGGGICLRCRTLQGSGAIQANGGSSAGGSGGRGGGGRIAVWAGDTNGYGGAVSVIAGTAGTWWGNPANDAQPGTVYWGLIPASGTVILIR